MGALPVDAAGVVLKMATRPRLPLQQHNVRIIPPL
jgi:hypothetical protein